jgi:hypothetical protein
MGSGIFRACRTAVVGTVLQSEADSLASQDRERFSLNQALAMNAHNHDYEPPDVAGYEAGSRFFLGVINGAIGGLIIWFCLIALAWAIWDLTK